MLSGLCSAFEVRTSLMPQLLTLCETRVHQLLEQDSEEAPPFSFPVLVTHVAAIVNHNMATQRGHLAIGYQSASEHTDEFTDLLTDVLSNRTLLTAFQTYIDRVIVHFLSEYAQVRSLAAPHDEAWKQLHDQLAVRGYRVLLRLHVPPDQARGEATDFSQETCEIIYRTYFPFDVPLEAWATRILTNRILQRYTRSQDVADRAPTPLSLNGMVEDRDEASLSCMERLSDAAAVDALNHIMVRELLERSIASLKSRPQQQVILGTFFHGLSDAELAHQLQKSIGAIHILRHRALGRLQRLLLA